MNNFIVRLILTVMQICGNETGMCILLAVSDLEEYSDNRPTGKVIGQKMFVVCPDNMYEKITVKVKGKAIITNEQIKQKGGKVKVNFKNLTGKFYRTNSGEYALTCNADGVEVVS